MSTKTSVNAIACAPGALAGGPVRTRFFDGMFLTQADLENEQRYWRIKRRLTNRALGEGVVWGLRLGVDLERQRLALSPGYALDCCGNDLVVECPVETTVAELWTRADPALRGDGVVVSQPGGGRAPDSKAGERAACVVLQYTECPEDARPVHQDACGGPTAACETSRIRESTRLLLVPPPVARPLSPPEAFLAALEKWKAELPADVRDALFPPAPTPPPTPSTNALPVAVTVTVPGTPAASDRLEFPASGSLPPGGALTAIQIPAAGRRTGVVTFELTTAPALHFTAGRVLDQGRAVETVFPPAAPTVYWSLDVALPAQITQTSILFRFDVDDLHADPAFGDAGAGRLTGRISGRATVRAASGDQVEVTVDQLVLETVAAEGFAELGEPGCLRELVPWGWTVDPANGGAITRALLLTGLYGFLAELVARNANEPRWVLVAQLLYASAWRALFGANVYAGAPVTEAHRRGLVALIGDLLDRWCDGLMYPGPRCSDEHHGVYLGCAILDRRNRIVAFDPWEHRRYVLTGPLVNHWAGEFGIAPLDVIVGRFARALCCVADLPTAAFTQPPTLDNVGRLLRPGIVSERRGLGVRASSGDSLFGRFHTGDVDSTERYASGLGAPVRWLSLPMLAARATTAFTDGGAGTEVLAAAIEGGGVVALAVPTEVVGGDTRVRVEVTSLLRRGEHRVRPSGRVAIVEFVGAVLAASPAVAVLHPDTSPAAVDLAERASKRGLTAADLVELDEGQLTRRLRLSAGDSDALAELVDIGESTLDFLTVTTARVVGPNGDRARFANDDVRKKLADSISGEVLKIDGAVVEGAAARVAQSG
jgi:hypothetical protein